MSTPDQNATDFTKCLQLVVERLQRNETKVATFRVRRSRGEMYIGYGHLCVCLSLAAWPHYCTDLDVTWWNGRGCPLVGRICSTMPAMHRSVHGFHSFVECLYLLYAWWLCLLIIHMSSVSEQRQCRRSEAAAVHPPASSVCLSVCPACNVGVFWPNGWMDQDATWYGGSPRTR